MGIEGTLFPFHCIGVCMYILQVSVKFCACKDTYFTAINEMYVVKTRQYEWVECKKCYFCISYIYFEKS